MDRVSAGSRDPAQLKVAQPLESQPAVEVDRANVGGAHVQPGYLAVAAMLLREMADEICGQTLAAMVPMRADAAQLRIALEAQALAAMATSCPFTRTPKYEPIR